MATWKFTGKRGGTIADVTKGSGATISGGDAIEVNVDATNMTAAEFAVALDTIKAKALETVFPGA